MKKPQKVRVEFRKNRNERTRSTDWTRRFEEHEFEDASDNNAERIVGKSELSRRRTVIGELLEGDGFRDGGYEVVPDVDVSRVKLGRVIRVHGASSDVQTDDGQIFRCVTRRILKTLSTKERQPVVAGDRVLFRPATLTNNQNKNIDQDQNKDQDQNRDRDLDQNQNSVNTPQHIFSRKSGYIADGMIERIESRRGVLSRESKYRKHLIVANVDQVLIISSVGQPVFKPNLVDRMLITAEKSGIKPIICINKIDLIDPVELQPIVGVYSQMGYVVVLTSIVDGVGIDRLGCMLKGRESVIAGQSGVGKSSLLNAVDPNLKLRVSDLGTGQKGKHTTSTAELLQLTDGGYVVDTPGIRQFMLWDIIPAEVFGFFRDLRAYENFCHYPNCTHLHEEDCAVKNAVAEGRLDLRRYESYLSIRFEEKYSGDR
ncbi:MAG: ribosome small subunit-dependent GTPase A [Planctomycetaceae bacterium]|jgi:ribosome biogenesis GTPase|nr:ribosome small subunit-dependent GTPase A [Planctomycetaceae bacterium]